MTFAPVTIRLTPNQIEVLTELGIDSTKLYFVDDDKLANNAPAINAYSSGHYVIFVSDNDDDEAKMVEFMKAFYGANGTYKAIAKFRSLFVYTTPSSRFALPENLIEVEVIQP